MRRKASRINEAIRCEIEGDSKRLRSSLFELAPAHMRFTEATLSPPSLSLHAMWANPQEHDGTNGVIAVLSLQLRGSGI